MASCRDPGEFFWQDSPGRAEVLAHSSFFQHTTQLDALVEASRLNRVVVLTGEAGVGKSSLAIALARTEIAGGYLPDGFVRAMVILTRDTNPVSLANDLQLQLRVSVPGFADGVAEFRRSVPISTREKLDAVARKVLRPLEYLAHKPELRFVFDGFDRLPDLTRDAVREALTAFPENVRIVITTRPEAAGCL
jgi:ATP/maltotriose-dependent transcriptional regulator MalT